MSKFIYSIVVVLILLTALVNLSLGQEKPIRVGVLGGANLAMTNVDIVGMNRDVRTGLIGGGLFEYWLNPNFAFHTDLLFSMKGAKYGLDMGIASADINWTLNYLSIPVMAKVALGESVKIYLLIGPEFSFLLSGKQKTETQALGNQTSKEVDLKDYMNSFEIALSSGLGIEVPIGDLSFIFEGRGALSLSDINKEVPPGFSFKEEKAMRNMVGSLTVGLIY